MGLAGDKTERELKGLGSILPVVGSDQMLGRGRSLFPDLKVDLEGLKKLAGSEFGSSVPNNITHLIRTWEGGVRQFLVDEQCDPKKIERIMADEPKS